MRHIKITCKEQQASTITLNLMRHSRVTKDRKTATHYLKQLIEFMGGAQY